MHLRRFRGKQLPDVVRQVREELGPEAVILHTKASRPRGLLRFVRGAAVEIVAAVDEPTAPSLAPRPDAGAPGLPGSTGLAGAAGTPARGDASGGPRRAGAAPDAEWGPVAELRDLLIRLSGARALPPMFAPFYTWLLRSGVEETLAFRILEAVSPADAHGQPLSAEQVSRVIEDRMTELVRVADVSLAPRDATVAFVGPAGAGKTTTLCKLAVHAYLAGATVDVLSLDDHGFGAAGPLEALSAILGVPYQQAATPDELAGVLERGLLRDVTVIDTPGVSPRDDAGVARLERMLRLARPTAVHLVLSATTKIDDALAAVNGFGRLGITHVLFSKLDETSTYGSVFSVGVLSGVPLSYFATGREIPNDIKPATARELARYVVRGG